MSIKRCCQILHPPGGRSKSESEKCLKNGVGRGGEATAAAGNSSFALAVVRQSVVSGIKRVSFYLEEAPRFGIAG
jgi:hypothetical protein